MKTRYVQCFLAFLLVFTAFFLRLNMSIAIVAMTNRNSANPDFEEMDWDIKTRSRILSGFSIGYMVMQMPAGQLGQLFSVKTLLLAANTVCSLLALLTPLAALYGGWLAVALIRAGQGVCEGFYFPLIYNLASKWAPPDERNRFIGYALNGANTGAVVTVAVTGLLASSAGGWPSVFYVSGVLGLVWTALWWLLGADSPFTHPTIDPSERDYIQAALVHSSQSKIYPTPWRSIITSPPVLALVAANVCSGWGLTIVTFHIPAYLNSVLGFDIKTNGFVSALTYVVPWATMFPICWLADLAIKKHFLTVIAIRKLATTVCLGAYGLVFLSFCLVDQNAIMAVTILTTALTLSSFMFCGFFINHLDLSPNFAGVLMGLSNGLETISAVIASLSVGWIISDSKSVEDWRRVFIAVAIISIIGNIVFLMFASGEVQSWNTPQEEKGSKKKNST